MEIYKVSQIVTIFLQQSMAILEDSYDIKQQRYRSINIKRCILQGD